MSRSMLRRKKNTALAAVLAAGLLCCGCTCSSDTKYDNKTSIISENADYTEFIEKTDEYLKTADFQGAVLFSKGEEIIFAKGYGKSDEKDPASEDITIKSTFEIGSITKQFTAASILQLEEKGLLSTEDKLSKYYPEYKYGDMITIDMLLHMRSGLNEHIDDYDSYYPADVAEKIRQAELNCEPVEEGIALKYFYENDLVEPPDTAFRYCNLNYHLLADIVERVSGMEYDDYIKTKLFDACGMTNSNLDFQGTTTVAYDGAGRYYSIPKSICKGAGEINSNVIDLWKWNNALLGGRVLGEEALEKMLTAKGMYACGLYANPYNIVHGGSTDLFNSYNIIYRNDDVQIIVLINRPIDRMSSTTIAGNIRYFYDECFH